jgi:hypothetical protein
MKINTNYPFFNVVARSPFHIFEFQKSIIISENKIYKKKKIEKKSIIKLLVYIQIPINIFKDILIIIHVWAKGAPKKHNFITKMNYHTLHLPNLVLWYVMFYYWPC